MTNRAQQKRRDLQGLRAVAVGLVILEHTFGLPAGGFVGVDVFFVLSGFLITGLLLKEHTAIGRIRLFAFSVRRVRRLFPAAGLVLVVTVAVSFVLLPAVRAEQTAVDAGWSAVFLANWHFAAQQTDYFAADGPQSPFQHFWSLSVEEQFYLVIPGLLALTLWLSRAGRAVALTVVALMTSASLAWAVLQTAADPSTAYFSSLTRAWELGFGSVLAFGAAHWSGVPSRVGAILTTSGVVGIVVSALVLDEGAPFPAPAALVPVLSTALVLIGGTTASDRHLFLLTNRPMVAVGDISYSLYLWHFPVLVMIGVVEPHAVWIVVPLSVALATVTYHLVEQPFMSFPGFPGSERRRHQFRAWRGRQMPRARRAFVGALAIGAAIAALLAVERTQPRPVPPAVAGPATPAPAASGAATATTTLSTEIVSALQATAWPTLEQDPGAEIVGTAHPECASLDSPAERSDCTFGPSGAAKTIMLVGDSTAAHEADALIAVVEEETNTYRLVVRTAFGCPFLDAQIKGTTGDACDAHRASTLTAIEEVRPDLLLVVNTFAELPLAGSPRNMTSVEFASATESMLAPVRSSVGATAVLTPPPSGASIESCYRPGGSPVDCITRVGSTWKERLASLRSLEDDLDIVDTRQLYCAGDTCPAFVGKTVVKKDFVHLTSPYAVKTAPALLELLHERELVDP